MNPTHSNPTCISCGYDLTGLIEQGSSAACPECGHASREHELDRRPLTAAILILWCAILVPAILVPILGINAIKLMSLDQALSFARFYLPLSVITPIIWITTALFTICYLYTGRTRKGDKATIITLILIIIPFSTVAYYVLILFTAMMVSGI